MVDRAIAATSLIRGRVLESARNKTLDTTYGHYPAPLRLLDVLQTSYRDGMKAGLEAERRPSWK